MFLRFLRAYVWSSETRQRRRPAFRSALFAVPIIRRIFTVENIRTYEMKHVETKDLRDNFFEAIGKEWMLVTAGTKERFNTMTASWGGVGFLWGKPVAFIFIRPERYTFEFLENSDSFTLSFLGEENKGIHKVCGSKSGREVDKVKETGLMPFASDSGNVLFEQARLSLECRKLYSDMLKADGFIDKSLVERWYGEGVGNFHRMYVGEITDAWLRE